MRAKKHMMRTAVAVGVAGLAFSSLAPVTASADEIVSKSGHKVCPAGQQVRVWSLSWGESVKHHWYSDNGTYGTDARDILIGPVDTQTFTLQRDVYWRVVAEGPRPNIEGGAKCY